MTLPMVLPLKLRQAGRAAWRPMGNVGGSSADPPIQPPLDTRFAAFAPLTGSYRRAPRARKSVGHEIASGKADAFVDGYRAIAGGGKGG
jgi:hypothetical protein